MMKLSTFCSTALRCTEPTPCFVKIRSLASVGDKSNGEKCLDNEPHEDDDDDHGGDDAPDPVIEAPGPGIEVVTTEDVKNDVPRYIAKLLDGMTTPEESVSFGEVEPGKRADQADVQRRIDALSFRRSPADVPAFYDFHSLQIAFE